MNYYETCVCRTRLSELSGRLVDEIVLRNPTSVKTNRKYETQQKSKSIQIIILSELNQSPLTKDNPS